MVAVAEERVIYLCSKPEGLIVVEELGHGPEGPIGEFYDPRVLWGKKLD